MAEPTTFATRAELDLVKKEQQRMAIQIEVLNATLTGLTRQVAALAESTNARFDAVDAKVDALKKDVNDGFAALTSVILAMGKNR